MLTDEVSIVADIAMKVGAKKEEIVHVVLYKQRRSKQGSEINSDSRT